LGFEQSQKLDSESSSASVARASCENPAPGEFLDAPNSSEGRRMVIATDAGVVAGRQDNLDALARGREADRSGILIDALVVELATNFASRRHQSKSARARLSMPACGFR